MKKAMKFFSMAALCIAMVAMVGCSKDEEQPAGSGKVVVSTTTIGLGSSEASKHLDESGTKTFAAGEEIAVIYENTSSTMVKTTVTLTAGDISNGGKEATVSVAMTDPEADGAVKFIYPASMANDDGTVNYDALYNNQDGTMATLSSNFDYAEYSGTLSGEILPADNLMLTNQLAVLKFTVQNTANSQDITSSVTMLTVKHGSDIYSVTPATSQSTFWVAVKPIDANDGDIAIYAVVGKDLYKKTVSSYGDLAAGTFNRIAVGATQIPGALSGLFRVNASNDLVYFSQGNLQATTADLGTTWSWAFATNQWDCIGNAAGNTSINGNGTVSANGTVDLFGWVGASSTVLTSAPAMYGISNSTTNSDYGNSTSDALKSDWGTLAITNGGNTANSGWRTLNSDEWTYLFSTRSSGSTVNGKSDARWTHATINTDGTSVNGMILFPDGVTIANSEATSWGSINANNSRNTQCTTAQWAALEAKGCVFLRDAGYRDGSSVKDAGTRGRYWSSTPDASNASYAYSVLYGTGTLYLENPSYRSSGRSVRLVRQFE
jgi:hypothetical protein